ncbi:hypothetical protein SAMN05216378_4393 [Paenibacillus catalpae]|uniref:Uncharacterized protein n=1 Tax=Paenibacillus catalpae TaxID=1045775 RepID=A0A1I2E1S7_9BACL|nr:hypothetical protein [Paenibacillus catalpae]SFE86834.1 hypothetical protein SAMN05216378_4393 [Paenibacillus catalpae]
MKAIINLNPVLTEEIKLKSAIQFIDYGFEYDEYGIRRSISAEPVTGFEHTGSKLALQDERGVWNEKTHSLIVSRSIILQKTDHLFGSNGVAGLNAEIGTAIVWKSKSSNQRGIFVGDSFDSNSSKRQFNISGEFLRGSLRDKIELSTIMYIKSPGSLLPDENHLANNAGFIIGEFDTTTIHIKGTGSFFPISTISEDGPLWRVEINWDDPTLDLFEEQYVKILLNERHPDYKHLDFSNNLTKLSPLMREVLASSLQIIIQNVTRTIDVQSILSGTNIASGSICQVVQYFIQTFEWNTSSPEELASSIRKGLDKLLGGGTV